MLGRDRRSSVVRLSDSILRELRVKSQIQPPRRPRFEKSASHPSPSWPTALNANEKVEQLAANNLTIPQDVIASLLQRLVRNALSLVSSHSRDKPTQKQNTLTDSWQLGAQLSLGNRRWASPDGSPGTWNRGIGRRAKLSRDAQRADITFSTSCRQ